jgi:hypothetical protein
MRKHDKKKKAALFRKWQLSGERKADFSTATASDAAHFISGQKA